MFIGKVKMFPGIFPKYETICCCPYPSRASCGVSCMRIDKKINRVITAPHCMWLKTFTHFTPPPHLCCSWPKISVHMTISNFWNIFIKSWINVSCVSVLPDYFVLFNSTVTSSLNFQGHILLNWLYRNMWSKWRGRVGSLYDIWYTSYCMTLPLLKS